MVSKTLKGANSILAISGIDKTDSSFNYKSIGFPNENILTHLVLSGEFFMLLNGIIISHLNKAFSPHYLFDIFIIVVAPYFVKASLDHINHY